MEAEAEAVSSHWLWKRKQKLPLFFGCGSRSGWQKKVIIGSGSRSYWKKNLHFWVEAKAAKIFFTKMEAEAEAMKIFFSKLKRKRKRHQDLPLPKHWWKQDIHWSFFFLHDLCCFNTVNKACTEVKFSSLVNFFSKLINVDSEIRLRRASFHLIWNKQHVSIEK